MVCIETGVGEGVVRVGVGAGVEERGGTGEDGGGGEGKGVRVTIFLNASVCRARKNCEGLEYLGERVRGRGGGAGWRLWNWGTPVVPGARTIVAWENLGS